MRLFYKEDEIDISKIENELKIKKLKGGTQIRYFEGDLYVSKGKKIQKYVFEHNNVNLVEEIQIKCTIQDFIINEKYIVVKNSDCAISIYDRKNKNITERKNWKKKCVEHLCWKEEKSFFIILNKVLCEINILNFELIELCDLNKALQGECVSVQSSIYNGKMKEYKCFLLYYKNDVDNSEMQQCLLKVDMKTSDTIITTVSENMKTLCAPTFHSEQEKISIINNHALYICEEDLSVTTNLTLPYYKVIKDGGGLFKPEEFTGNPMEIRFLENENEIVVMYEHGIICWDMKEERIMYQYYLGADLLLNCIVLEHGRITFNTGINTFFLR